MNSSLKDKLRKAGLQMSPKAEEEEKMAGLQELNRWRFAIEERILNADDMTKEIGLIIEEARNLFQGSSEQLQNLRPLYRLKDDLLNKRIVSFSELKLRVRKLW